MPSRSILSNHASLIVSHDAAQNASPQNTSQNVSNNNASHYISQNTQAGGTGASGSNRHVVNLSKMVTSGKLNASLDFKMSNQSRSNFENNSSSGAHYLHDFDVVKSLQNVQPMDIAVRTGNQKYVSKKSGR